jgi:hypothetical protein
VRDPAEGCGADVDIGLGLDLPGSADDRDEIFAGNLCSRNFRDAGLVMLDGPKDDSYNDQQNDDDKNDLLGAHYGSLDAPVAASSGRSRLG